MDGVYAGNAGAVSGAGFLLPMIHRPKPILLLASHDGGLFVANHGLIQINTSIAGWIENNYGQIS
jgi:hypothetical protein